MSMSVTVWADRAQKATKNQMLSTCLTWTFFLSLDSYWQTSLGICPFELGKSHQQKIHQTLLVLMYHNFWGGKDQRPIFTLHLTQDDSVFSGSPVVAMKGVLVKVGWVRWIFWNEFLWCFDFFVFTPSKRDVFLYKHMGFSILVGVYKWQWFSRNGKVGELDRWWRQFLIAIVERPEVVMFILAWHVDVDHEILRVEGRFPWSLLEWTNFSVSITCFWRHPKFFWQKKHPLNPSCQGGLMDLQPDIPEAKRVPKAQFFFSPKEIAELLFGEKNTVSPKVSNKKMIMYIRSFETLFYWTKNMIPSLGWANWMPIGIVFFSFLFFNLILKRPIWESCAYL